MFEKIRFTVFDIFGYIIPGLFYIILIILAAYYLTLEELIGELSSLSFYSLIFYFLIAYIIGFAFDELSVRYILFFGRIIMGNFNDLVLRSFKKSNPEAKDEKIENYAFDYIYAYVDVHAPHVREKSDSLSALSNMVRNISFSFFIYAFITLVYFLLNIRHVQWWMVCIKFLLAILISYFLLYRSARFKRYSHAHLFNSYYILSRGNGKDNSAEKTKDKRNIK